MDLFAYRSIVYTKASLLYGSVSGFVDRRLYRCIVNTPLPHISALGLGTMFLGYFGVRSLLGMYCILTTARMYFMQKILNALTEYHMPWSALRDGRLGRTVPHYNPEFRNGRPQSMTG